MSAEELPRVACRFCEDAPDWGKIPRQFLCDAVTGAEPRQRSFFQTGWTSNHLHVLFNNSDTNAWATWTARDAPLYEEEVVEVFLDPAGDLESYFELEVNPRNAVCDLVLRKTRSGYRKCLAWDCLGLQTATETHPHFWTVKMAIPFASLTPDGPRAGATWRANFCRIDRPPNVPRELSAWSPTGRPLFHVPPRFGWIDFVA